MDNPKIETNQAIVITPLTASRDVISALADMLVETVANGGSVSFMYPLEADIAANFWKDSLGRASAGGRVVLGATANGELAGTVTLDLATPQNQPHRADIAKLITRVSHRRRGIARALMQEAERIAVERGRTLLVLDTAEDGGAAGLYEGLGYQRAGVIPDYAFKPHGGLTGTIIYFKRIA